MRAISPAFTLEDRGFFRRELEGVAVAAGDEHGAAASLLLLRSRRGEKIVGLVAGAPGIGEAAGGGNLRNQFKLLDELVVDVAAEQPRFIEVRSSWPYWLKQSQ